MTRSIKHFLALLAVLLLPMAAQADLFKYSYEFDDGTAISGLLAGTASGNFVTNITDITLSINHVHYDTLSLFSYWVIFATSGETPTVSFDGTLNNFWFVDPAAADANGNIIGNGGYGFALIGSAVNTPLAQRSGNNLAFVNDLANGIPDSQFLNNSSWQLHAVPEPGTLALLGLGLLGMAASRRKKV